MGLMIREGAAATQPQIRGNQTITDKEKSICSDTERACVHLSGMCGFS
jgi:hypothetical protein